MALPLQWLLKVKDSSLVLNMEFSLKEVDSSWWPFFAERETAINSILEPLVGHDIAPARDSIFRAFLTPLDKVKVVILGQDPYPGIGVADGLAFSTLAGTSRPASLRNIFKEYTTDLSYDLPQSNDLTPWATSGVLLLNRTLTTTIGSRNAHVDSGWKELTAVVVQYLAQRDVVGILWGKYAEELSPYFQRSIISAHPSPLSAHRGFFGSRPFSRTNEFLLDMNISPVDWKLP